MLCVKTSPAPLIRFHCRRLPRANSSANCRAAGKTDDIYLRVLNANFYFLLHSIAVYHFFFFFFIPPSRCLNDCARRRNDETRKWIISKTQSEI